jgi:hypothetical protein
MSIYTQNNLSPSRVPGYYIQSFVYEPSSVSLHLHSFVRRDLRSSWACKEICLQWYHGLTVCLHRWIFLVGRLVVVIDVNPSHGFWTARLMKVFGHEGKCTCRYNTHGWIVYIMLFLVVCGTSRGSSWLRRNEFLKMTK